MKNVWYYYCMKNMCFGEYMRKVRKKLRYTQLEFSKLLNIHHSAQWQFECTARNVPTILVQNFITILKSHNMYDEKVLTELLNNPVIGIKRLKLNKYGIKQFAICNKYMSRINAIEHAYLLQTIKKVKRYLSRNEIKILKEFNKHERKRGEPRDYMHIDCEDMLKLLDIIKITDKFTEICLRYSLIVEVSGIGNSLKTSKIFLIDTNIEKFT